MSSTAATRFTTALAAGLLVASAAAAMTAQATLDFEDPNQYGNPDELCANEPRPPLFNRPEYGPETAAYIVDPAGCGEGVYGGGFGSDSVLTAAINATNSNLLRFSWTDPTDNRTWLRLPAYSAGGQSVLDPSPTVHLGVGSSIEMKVAVYAFDVSEVENPSGQLEFALVIRETGLNLPLGFDGGTSGSTEFVGITSKGSGDDLDTPIGGVPVSHSATVTWTTLKWTFVDVSGAVKVEVSIDGGAPVQKDVIGLSGDGALAAAYDRGTLAGLAIHKPQADTASKKWFVWIDDITIDAPAATDPIYVQSPVRYYDTQVTIRNITPTATAIKLYRDSGGGPALIATVNSTDPGVDFSDGEETITGLSLTDGGYLTATQVVDSIESDPSAVVAIDIGITIVNFSEIHIPEYPGWNDVTAMNWSTTEDTTLDGSPAMKILDTGYANGVYEIFTNVVPPAGGSFHVSALVDIVEGGATDAIDAYQIGVHPGGTHRDGEFLAPCPYHGGYVGLTDGDDTPNPTQTVYTSEFSADGGEDLLIAFSTDVTSGSWNANSQLWGSPDTYLVVDEVMLLKGPPPISSCDAVQPVQITGPLVHDDTTVTVMGVEPSATAVKVYVNGSLAGELNTAALGGGTKVVTLPSPATLARGDQVYATQVYPDSSGGQIEGCIFDTAVVGSGPNRNGVGVCIGVRETHTCAAIGADGGFNGSIEFIGASGYLAGSAPATTHFVTADGTWQSVSFDPLTDPILSCEGGDGVLQSDVICKKGTLEHIAIVPDPNAAPDSGPWVVYIDDVMSGTTTITDFESFATGTEQAMIRNPAYLPAFGATMLTSPNTSVVVDTQAHSGSRSLKCEWQFKDEGDRWARLTTYSVYGLPSDILPNPAVSFAQPIRFWIRLDPPPPLCHMPAQDVEGDGDVDLADFGVFSQCFNGPNRAYAVSSPPELVAKCECLDQDGDSDVDLADFGVFSACFNGPNRAPAIGCP